VQALDRLHTRQRDNKIRPWLFTILHNLYVRRARRKRARRVTVPLGIIGESMLGLNARREEHADTMRALEGLPEDLLSVLLLVTLEDFSYAAVAQVLDIPIGTVIARLSRAREQVRQGS
jgi:RNA polymerase sigma-70 factor (ECF subfamily)